MRSSRLLTVLSAPVLLGIIVHPTWPPAGCGVIFEETARAGQLSRPSPRSAVAHQTSWLLAWFDPLQGCALPLGLHQGVGLWGMYRLLRARRLDRRAALLGGIAFVFSGFLLTHQAEPATQHAAAWLPWVLWRLHRYAHAGGVGRLAATALVGGWQCIGGQVQIAAITVLGSLVLLLAQRRGSPRHLGVRWLLGWSCAAGLSAVQWLPTLAYVSVFSSTPQAGGELAENGWNPIWAIGWIMPMLPQLTPGGPPHQLGQFGYPGILPLLLAGLALRVGWRSHAFARGWAALLLLGLLLALKLGEGLLLFNLAVAGLAADVLDDLGGKLSPRRARLRAAAIAWTRKPHVKALVLLAIPLGVALAALSLSGAEPRQALWSAVRPWSPVVWVAALTVSVSVAAFWLISRRWRRPGWLWLLVVVTAGDLGIAAWTLDVPSNHIAVMTAFDVHRDHVRHPRGRAFLADASQPGAVRYVEKTPYSFTTSVDTWPSDPGGGGRLSPGVVRVVVARRAAPGWRAWADGERLKVGSTEDNLLVASVPEAGPVEIEWSYSPPGLHAGAAITGVSGMLLACFALLDRFDRRDRKRPRELAEP